MSAAPKSQVNLKDRIAALQQRNAGSSEPKPLPQTTNPTTGSLRDKIASFEKQGAVPVPRGSFGLGALPVDDGSSKRRGEMYGNRVPGLSRPTTPVSATHLSTALHTTALPERRTRRVSASDLSASASMLLRDTPSFPESVDEDALVATSDVPSENQISPTSPRRPSPSKTHQGRRSVSDILMRFNTLTSPVGETLGERREKSSSQAVEPQSEAPPAPVIIVSSEPVVHEFQALEPSHPPGDYSLSDRTDLVQSSQPIDAANVESCRCRDHDMPSVHAETVEVEPISSSPRFSQIIAEAESQEAPQRVSVPVSNAESAVSTTPATTKLSPADTANIDQAPAGSPTSSLVIASTIEASISEESGMGSDAEDVFKDAFDIASVTDRTSSGSSKLYTPTDFVDFPSTESSPSKEMYGEDRFFDATNEGLTLDAQHAILATAPRAASSPASTTLAIHIPVADEADDVGNQSLALDAGDAIIVSERPRVVSPTRAVLVPVPHALSPTTSASPSPSSSPTSSSASPSPVTAPSTATPFVELSLTPKPAQKTFRAVVHRRVPTPLQLAPPPQAQLQPRAQSARPARSARSVQPVPVQPASAEFGDLAALLVDAALLEQQLSVLGSPPKNVQATSASPVSESALLEPETEPELLEPETPRAAESPQHIDSPAEVEVVHESLRDLVFPTLPWETDPEPEPKPEIEPRREQQPLPPLPQTPQKEKPSSDARSLYESPPPPPPPTKSPRQRYFSTLLARRPTAPPAVAYPRASMSISSETSEDESVLVTLPQELGSDTSSVRSSNRSLKLPGRKGIARATSFADRLWHKRDSTRSSVSPDSQEDESRLSARGVQPRAPSPRLIIPSPAPTPRWNQSRPTPEQRPTSWVSVSSFSSASGNTSLLDSELFDAFPSVPDDVHPVLPIPEHGRMSFLSPLAYAGPPSAGVVDRANLPPRSSSLPKQRSTLA